MDIKLKKCRSIIGFTAFFLGVSLVAVGGTGLLSSTVNHSSFTSFSNVLETDYQNTKQFRSYLSNVLEQSMVMAEGGMPEGAGVEYSYEYSVSDSQNYETAVISDYASETADAWGYDWSGNLPSKQECETAAKQRHEAMKADKNLLYIINYDGKTKYTNADGLGLDGASGTLPEGYNFLLYLKDGKVKISKDGRDVDVYGDGYYQEASDWYVPGYRNFTVDDGMQKAEVTLAVAKNPILYSQSNSGNSGFTQMHNELYWMQYHRDKLQRACVQKGVEILVGAAFLLLSAALWKDKKRADAWFAGKTRRLWFEWKLLVPAVVSAVMISRGIYWGMGSIWEWCQPVLLLLLIWSLYFFINDLRHHEKEWRHGGIYQLFTTLQTRQMKYPLTKRLVIRYIPVLVGWALLFAAVMVAFLSLNPYMMYYPVVTGICIALAFFLVMALQYGHIRKTKQTALDMELLTDRIACIRSGVLADSESLPADSDLRHSAEELDDIRRGMKEAVEEQVKSERMKVELITNVSHDVKTPLTSIISYVELLKQEEDLPDYVRDYVKILDDKAQRLKYMVQDVFEVSKASTGQLPVQMETLDFAKLLRQTMADMQERIQEGNVVFRIEIPEEPVMIQADGKRLYRVFQNLILNALQYSLEGSRVFLTLQTDGAAAVASVKNTSRTEIKQNVDYTERFARGDESRTDGGSGLGLSIARSFTEACGGSFLLETIADLFIVTVTFTVVK